MVCEWESGVWGREGYRGFCGILRALLNAAKMELLCQALEARVISPLINEIIEYARKPAHLVDIENLNGLRTMFSLYGTMRNVRDYPEHC